MEFDDHNVNHDFGLGDHKYQLNNNNNKTFLETIVKLPFLTRSRIEGGLNCTL